MLDALPVVLDPDAIDDDIASCQRAVTRALEEFRVLARPLAHIRVASDKSAELFELSHAYAALHAAACSLAVWRHNRDRLGVFFARGDWLVRGVARLLRNVDPSLAGHHAPASPVADELRRRIRESLSFSLDPIAR
jgi:hypothetical protein